MNNTARIEITQSYLATHELEISESFWLEENQKSFDQLWSAELPTEMDLFRCMNNFFAVEEGYRIYLHFVALKKVFLQKNSFSNELTAFSKRHDVLDFSDFLYLPQITQYNCFIFFIIENILILFYHFFHDH